MTKPSWVVIATLSSAKLRSFFASTLRLSSSVRLRLQIPRSPHFLVSSNAVFSRRHGDVLLSYSNEVSTPLALSPPTALLSMLLMVSSAFGLDWILIPHA